MLKQLLIFPLFFTIVLSSVHITFPDDITFNKIASPGEQYGDPNYLEAGHLGSIAPGQALQLSIDRSSGTGFFWDNLELTIPPGWQVTGAKYADRFQRDIIIPKDTARGRYVLTLSLNGDIQVITPEILELSVDVSNDVYSIEVDHSYSAHIDTSNLVAFSVSSDSLASDEVTLSMDGIPADWMQSKKTVLLPKESRKTFFLIEPKTEGSYPIQFTVSSSLGGAGGSASSTMIVHPASLKSKLEVLNEGFSIVTVVLQPLYSLLSLIGSVI